MRMLLAEWLMYSVGGMGVLGGIVTTVMGAPAVWLVMSVITGCLWVWTARAYREDFWAGRAGGTALFVVITITTLMVTLIAVNSYDNDGTGFLVVLSLARWITAAVAVSIIWTRQVSRYYPPAHDGGRGSGQVGGGWPSSGEKRISRSAAQVTDDQVRGLRNCIFGNYPVDAVDDRLLVAVFYEAVGRRFGRHAEPRSVAEYVAKIINYEMVHSKEFDPREMEREILSFLHKQPLSETPAGVNREIYASFLRAVVSDMALDENEIEGMLAAARNRVDYLLSRERADSNGAEGWKY